MDIDAQAVEVTRFSLSLKALEDTRRDELREEMTLFKQAVLPDLRNNIKCGNSLIGSDYFAGKMFIDKDELLRIRPFDWEQEFPEIFSRKDAESAKGFDAVIGNPPYIPIFDLDKQLLKFFANKYKFYNKRYDSYALFIERILNDIIKKDGYLGYIIPSSLLNNIAFIGIRKYIIDNTALTEICLLGGKVFIGVNKDTMTLLLKKSQMNQTGLVNITFYNSTNSDWGGKEKHIIIAQEKLIVDDEFRLVDTDISIVLSKITNNFDVIRLDSICTTYQGIVTGSDEVFVVPNAEVNTFNLTEKRYLREFLFGSDIGRYITPVAAQRIIYLTRSDKIIDMPNFDTRIGKKKEVLKKRRETLKGVVPWYALHWPRDYKIFEKPKILVQGIRNLTLKRRIVATYDDSGAYAGVNLCIINIQSSSQYNMKYLLGIINSNLVNFLFRNRFVDHRIKNIYLDLTPIHRINFSDPADKLRHDKMVNLVESMLSLHKLKASVKTQTEQDQIQRQITATDREIDILVYELYNLTPEEIAIVES